MQFVKMPLLWKQLIYLHFETKMHEITLTALNPDILA